MILSNDIFFFKTDHWRSKKLNARNLDDSSSLRHMCVSRYRYLRRVDTRRVYSVCSESLDSVRKDNKLPALSMGGSGSLVAHEHQTAVWVGGVPVLDEKLCDKVEPCSQGMLD